MGRSRPIPVSSYFDLKSRGVAAPEMAAYGREDGLNPLARRDRGHRAQNCKRPADVVGFDLPPELLVLPVELGRVDALLDDPVFFAPFGAYFDARIGRPSIPVETYLRLMFLKFRYRLGYESLCREVADSISWQRFCRIPFGTPAIQRITARTGHTPRAVTADRGYGQASVERDLHELGVHAVAIPRMSKPSTARSEFEHRRAFREKVKWRTGSEGRINHKFGYRRPGSALPPFRTSDPRNVNTSPTQARRFARSPPAWSQIGPKGSGTVSR
ncbi:MAG: transposase, family [Mycobacterium sp.]|nr:inferenceab initio prediction:Prodigal:2 [Mycobacterium sp.]MDT5053222.1 transposase, family [Mycobacterium sp.]